MIECWLAKISYLLKQKYVTLAHSCTIRLPFNLVIRRFIFQFVFLPLPLLLLLLLLMNHFASLQFTLLCFALLGLKWMHLLNADTSSSHTHTIYTYAVDTGWNFIIGAVIITFANIHWHVWMCVDLCIAFFIACTFYTYVHWVHAYTIRWSMQWAHTWSSVIVIPVVVVALFGYYSLGWESHLNNCLRSKEM